MICVYPDFYRAFACKASFCRNSCCRGWEIDVDEESAAYYRALPGRLGDDLRAALVEEAGVWHFRLTDDERCPFLRPDGLCRLIRELGEHALCDICALHPRFYGELGSFEFCGLGLSCEKVCELLFSSSAPLLFRLDDETDPVDFAGLLRRMGLEPVEELLCFTPKPNEVRYAEILRRLSDTEPIDEAWPEHLHQLRAALPVINAYEGPVYIRLFRKEMPEVFGEGYQFDLFKADTLREGTDLTVFVSGFLTPDVVAAADKLKEEGLSVEVVNVHTIKPIDAETVRAAAHKTGKVLTIENHNVVGGLHAAVLEALASDPVPAFAMGVQDRFGEVGKLPYLREVMGLTEEDIYNKMKELASK